MGAGRRSNAAPVVFARRSKERVVEALDHLFGPITVAMGKAMLAGQRFAWMRHIPPKPAWLSRFATPPVWPETKIETPAELRSYAGALRDPEAERRAFEERPLHDFNKMHHEAMFWTIQHSWTWLVPPYPALRRAIRALDAARDRPLAARAVERTPAELSALIRAEGKRLGISEVGFAKADGKYHLAEYPAPPEGANMIICILEQDFKATNSAPSSRAERAAFRAYGQVNARIAPLVEYVKSLGYETRPNDWGSQEAICIQYAVQAGMGQLGLNGQLLTPQAGSRCRLALITTMAPVAVGQPVDYGIPKLCDECQLCVRRCPPGAIPKARKEKRGVTKASIKPERCFPMVAQAHGCAVCMKVCPVQRYGLEKVYDHYNKTGAVLGKGTDELEGFTWPMDGRYYGPGQKPRMSAETLRPEGWVFDKTRVVPVGQQQPAPPEPEPEPEPVATPSDGE
ncbi:MAG TPA: 4Fe-4S dicluster domain-containing protein [Baekduia sp.]|uniref:4Fe-4S dicluster domain-containing protein n=1 Tax=Baekduia sp. TaxID=2600305 RepID=UPI002D7839A3|nr:4Fe-4S dicluster domain-containing protein [Baekduia sp.]HET6509957.1 4Fe-4S dicluster domain-containing protein [Baekduia sp.]